MKTHILFAFLLAAGFSFGQTKIIAHKSHSGNFESFSEEKDGNFGIPATHLDTVVKISDTCIVEINNFGWRDTVYNHPQFLKPGITLDELKATYPRITFVGFEKNAKKTRKNKRHAENKGSLYLMALLLGGSCLYTFKGKIIPFKNKKS